ncbi:hypothetical protein M5K25_015761 [Dendrobium thyrsiflorum]|uniref:Uncharacterized protein n=1 Tax=Dendrobium thyrsiflorum TaxID=117978 RepID=A0ABD0UR48_DENTH
MSEAWRRGDGDSAETVPDSCGKSSITYPTTPSSELVGLGGAVGNSGDEDLESSSSFLDEHQVRVSVYAFTSTSHSTRE